MKSLLKRLFARSLMPMLLLGGVLAITSSASATTYNYNVSGTYNVTSETFSGTLDVTTSPTDAVTSADITAFGSDVGTTAFTAILAQSLMGTDWSVELGNADSSWLLFLYLNNSDLFSGQTTPIDATFSYFALAANQREDDFNINSGGQLTLAQTATPLPPTLTLFAGGLGFVGYLARRRRKSTKHCPAIA